MVIIRQDRNGVRTPQDIERKYNFARLEKAVQVYENAINKENNTLDNFIYATIGSLATFEGLMDGNIATYYHSGVPTMENYPVVEWSESEYAEHIDDIYYDKDTGFAYVFFVNEETDEYGWSRTHAGYIIQAMAIANSASDTADGKRTVFTKTPYPPYANGDLWFKDGEIYICQISKDNGEVFEEDDFIIATKYTDDTEAKKVGEELTVVKGAVLKIRNDVDEFSVKIESAENKADEAIETTTNFMSFTEDEGLSVGNKKSGVWSGFRTRMKAKALEIVDIINGLDTVVARYGEKLIELGINATNAVISFCGGKGTISYNSDEAEGKEYLELEGEENTRVKGKKESALWASDKENGIGGKAVVKTYVDEENAEYVATMYANDGYSLEDDGDGYYGSIIKAMLDNGILMRTYSEICAIAKSKIELISNASNIVLSADKVYINKNPIEDFVIEEGTDGIWTYRKWNSGKAECWGTLAEDISFHITVPFAGDTVYRSDVELSTTFPSGLFVETPQCMASYQGAYDFNEVVGYDSFPFICTGRATATHTTKLVLMRIGSSISALTAYVDYYAIGVWK